ncbi:prominin-like protein isoform X2 [Scaptodrosophila lebanonensis]|uniref:Prominin-like protein isoform X2 n=1 Tax=Drosophila lebanonensis TaxID=7225 RepID=A0A6J2UDX6_DROLE|nr:prominin-like protein isoform X2 [Scaptodrosophila lebanonensis]
MAEGEEMELKPKTKRYKVRARKRRQRQIAYYVICGISVAIFGLALATIIRPISAETPATPAPDDPGDESGDGDGNETLAPPYWRKGYEGHGTTHEQLGQPHWPQVEYTIYQSKIPYSESQTFATGGMSPVFNFTHSFFDAIISDQAIPDGYIVTKGGDTLALGPKVEENQWRDLLAHYWVVWLLVLILLILIIVIPFIAVCYCCFCCCRRCKQGCPPCDRKKDARLRCCFGFLLLLLIIGILFGIIIALVTNKVLDRGFKQATPSVKQGTEDTCKYLKDVSDHVYHLLVYNYQELETQLMQELHDAHKHIFLDLSDTSESSAIEELLRILTNMPAALKLMRQLDAMITEARFLVAQLRDGVRGVKRDVNFACINLCGTQDCINFLGSTDIEFIDMSPCIHYDLVPNTTAYVEAMEDIIARQLVEIPKRALVRLRDISSKIREHLRMLTPPIIRDLSAGRDVFRSQATNIRNIIDAVISDIYLNTIHSTRSFEDVYEKFGSDRYYINLVICFILIVILVILIIALLFGCCGKRPRGWRDPCCNKGTGASCLLLAIILIFMVFSILTLIGLFYFIIGLVTYHGACAPLRDKTENALFRQLDSVVDLNKFMPRDDGPPAPPGGGGEVAPPGAGGGGGDHGGGDHGGEGGGKPPPGGDGGGGESRPPMHMSAAIAACEANKTIFQILRENGIYNIDELSRIKLLHKSVDPDGMPAFADDLSKVEILTTDEKHQLRQLANNSLANYHSSQFTEYLCKPLTPTPLPTMAGRLRGFGSGLRNTYYFAHISLLNEAYNLEVYDDQFVTKLHVIIDKFEDIVKEIDKLILYENNNFSASINILVGSIIRAEEFIKSRGKQYVNELGRNLSEWVEESVDAYKEYVIHEGDVRVGPCGPLAYLYHRGVDLICHRIVDPMNGFWVGLLLATLLFLPTLWVAHKLMCLYKKIDPYVAPAPTVVEGGDYLYDAYSEREHMPLANVPKKRRKGYDRRREQQEFYEDASPSGSRGARAEGPGSSNMRYNDMAPKHWDHEPPRYHNPPEAPPSSEYERPPPYYYPGAAEQD